MAQQSLIRDTTNTLYMGASAPLVGTIGVVSLTSYYLLSYTDFPQKEVYLFLSSVCSMVLIRFLLVYRYRVQSAKHMIRNFKAWELAFLLPTALTGVLFGGAAFYFHDTVDAAANMMLYIAVLGLASGASVSYYSSLPTLFSFLFTCTLPTIYTMLFRSQDPRDVMVGCLSVLWLLICIRSAKVAHAGFLRKDELKTKQLELHRLQGLNKLAGGVAHEINNPLAIISGLTEILRTNKDVENRERTFERIAHSIDRITSVTQSLLSLSEPTMLSGGGKQHSLKHFMKQIYELSRGIATKCNVEFAIEVSEESQDLTLNANQQLTEAITNIVINGIEAAEEGGENGERFTKIFVDSLGARIRIKIVDSGRGLEEKDVDDIFLPFYSTKALGKAKGLGLTVANSNIKNLGGELSLDQSGKYTCFVILLPEEELVYEHGMSREAG